MLFFAVLGILLFSAGMPAPTFIHMGHGFAEPERSQKEVCVEKRVSLSVEMATIKSETWNRQCMGSWKHKKELLNHQEATLLASIAMLSSLNETKVINLHEAIIEVIKKSPKSASHMRHIRKGSFVNLNSSEWHVMEKVINVMINNFNTLNAFSVLNLDEKEIYERFQVDEDVGSDVLKTLKYGFYCDIQNSQIELVACANMSQYRITGTIAKVAPKGRFVDNGTNFQYLLVPMWLMISPRSVLSLDNCSQFGATFACKTSEGACTFENDYACPIETAYVPTGVFTKVLDEKFVFVATRRPVFSIWDGKQTKTQHVGESGQFVLELPSGWSAYIGSNIIFGNSDKFSVTHVGKDEDTYIVEESKNDATNSTKPNAEKLAMLDMYNFITGIPTFLYWVVIGIMCYVLGRMVLDTCSIVFGFTNIYATALKFVVNIFSKSDGVARGVGNHFRK